MARTHKHSKHLVCQHMENLSRKALEKYQDVIKDFVRNRHGIYALYLRDKLYYVGLASNLRSRLSSHLRDRHAGTWDSFSIYLTIGDDKLRELEALLIRIAKPRGNLQRGKFPRSDDLNRTFKRRVLEKTRSDMIDMLGSHRSKKTRDKIVLHDKESGRKPTLSPFIKSSFEIRLRYKGKNFKARVRSDGSIRFNGKLFTSPSLAGKAARKKTTNGWTAWEFERAPGDWVPLDNLRR